MDVRETIRNIPQGVKSSAALFAARVVSMGVSFITVPLFTRLLTTDEYGQVSVFLSWSSMFGVIATFNFHGGIFNNGMVDYPDKRDEYSLSMLALSNIITFAFFAILFALYPFIKDWLGLDWKLIALMAVIYLVQPAYNFWSARQRYELKYKALLVTSVLSSVLAPLVALICVVHAVGNKADARIYGMECTSIAIYFVFYVLLIAKGQWRIRIKYWKGVMLFSLPLLPHYLSMYILSNSDRLMISRLVNDSATAYYSVAYSVATVATVIWSAANASLIPFTYEHCKRKDYKPISAVANPILAVVAACCVLVIILAPEVVAVIATEEYEQAIYTIPSVVGGAYFQVHYALYGNILFYYKKSRLVATATVISAVSNVVLNFIFIPCYGFIAAGYTTFFSYLVQAVIDYLAMLKTTGGKRIYNMRFVGLLSLGVVIISLLSNFIYDYAAIRYAILIGIMILCFVSRKKIIDAFKAMGAKEAV